MPRDAGKGYWLFVFFDLPVKSKPERRRACRFRKFLLTEGFEMMQFSVYVRYCRGAEAADKHVARIEHNLPPTGSVRTLHITETQYDRMRVMVGDEAAFEEKASAQMVLL